MAEADLHLEEVPQGSSVWPRVKLTRVAQTGIENPYAAKLGVLISKRSR